MSDPRKTSEPKKSRKYAASSRKKAHKSWNENVTKQIGECQEVAMYSKVFNGKMHFIGESRLVDFLSTQDLNQLSFQTFIEKTLEIQVNTQSEHVHTTKEFFPSGLGQSDDQTVRFTKFSKPIKQWTSTDCRREIMLFMNNLGFGYAFKSYGVITHQPEGWPRELNWKLWKPNYSKKEETKLRGSWNRCRQLSPGSL